jgi:tetratricopeptide (TPR) repeat protein
MYSTTHKKEIALTATPTWPPSGQAWHDAVAHERALIGQGRFDEALEICERMYIAAEAAAAPYGVLAMLWAHRGDMLRYQEDFEGAADAYAECLCRLRSIAERTNCPQILIIPLHTLAAIRLRLGCVDDARILLDQSDDALKRANPTLNRRLIQFHTTLLRAWSAVAADDLPTARHLYTQARQIADVLRFAPAHRLRLALDDGLRWLEGPAAIPPHSFLWDEPQVARPPQRLLARVA